jgi:hypothetical protein
MWTNAIVLLIAGAATFAFGLVLGFCYGLAITRANARSLRMGHDAEIHDLHVESSQLRVELTHAWAVAEEAQRALAAYQRGVEDEELAKSGTP